MCNPRHRLLDPSNALFGGKRRLFRGFSLVEVTLALGIMAFTMTALFGVFAVGARADRQSIMELEATHVIQSMVAGRRARPVVNTDTSLVLPPLNTPAPASGGMSSPVFVDKVGQSQTDPKKADFGLVYRIAPTKKTNGAGDYSDVYCVLYWPAQGQSANAEGRVEFATRVPLPPVPSP